MENHLNPFLKVIRIIQFSSFLKTIVLSLLSLCEAAPKHLDLSRLLSIESCGVLNPPSFHSNSFAKLERDISPASKAPSQSTSIINWLGWECLKTSSLIPSYLSLFILFYHIRNHISFVFAFVFRFITCIPSYRPSDHLFGRPIQASIIHLAHPESQPATLPLREPENMHDELHYQRKRTSEETNREALT